MGSSSSPLIDRHSFCKLQRKEGQVKQHIYIQFTIFLDFYPTEILLTLFKQCLWSLIIPILLFLALFVYIFILCCYISWIIQEFPRYRPISGLLHLQEGEMCLKYILCSYFLAEFQHFGGKHFRHLILIYWVESTEFLLLTRLFDGQEGN